LFRCVAISLAINLVCKITNLKADYEQTMTVLTTYRYITSADFAECVTMHHIIGCCPVNNQQNHNHANLVLVQLDIYVVDCYE
jgi:hypothetical protein